MSTKLALCTKKAKYNWLFCAAKSRRRRWRLAGAGGHERSRAASRPVHCSICWMPSCRRDFAIISSLRDGSGQWPSDFAHVPRTVPYTVLLLDFATPLAHCPEQPGLLTFGLPDSPTGKRTAGCSAQRSQGGGAGDQPAPGDMSEAEQSAVPGAGAHPARHLSQQGKLPEGNGWVQRSASSTGAYPRIQKDVCPGMRLFP